MPLTLYRRGEIWHYRGTVAGRRLRGSTKTSDRDTAQRIAAEKEARQWKGHLDGPGAVLTFAQAVKLYLAAQKPPRFLIKVADFWKDTPVREITSGAVKQAAITLHPRSSGATRNRQIIVPTMAVINHAAEMGLCARLQVKRFPVVAAVKEPATWEWIEAFAAHASPHLGALAMFMFLTGARISEALAVEWADLDVTAGVVKIRMGKAGGELRTAHLPAPLMTAIANIPGRERSGTVFKYSSRSTVKPSWTAAIRRAGIKALSPHSCRHGFATAMLQAGIDVRTVAELGGWKTPALVLSTYSHAVRDPRLTDRIIGTKLTQAARERPNKKTKSNG